MTCFVQAAGVETGELTQTPSATYIGTVDVSKLPKQTESRSFVVPNMLHPSVKRGDAPFPKMIESSPTTIVAPSTDSSSITAAPNIDVVFDGPTEGTPPDPSMAAGTNHVMVAINRVFSIYDKAGTLLQGPTDIDTFFGIGGFSVSFDPLVIHDPFEDRFILVIAADDSILNDSRLYIGFSASSDPTGTWNTYWIDADANQPVSSWADYPSIGLDNNAVYLAANMLARTGGNTTSALWSIDKRDGYNGLVSLDQALITDIQTEGGNAATDLRPAFMSELEGLDTYYLMRADAAFGSEVSVFTLTGPRFTTPTVTAYDVATPSMYTGPSTARQPGAGPAIDAIGGLLFNAAYRNGKVWGAHAVQNGADIISWVHRFDVSSLPPTREQTYTIAESGEDVYLPHVVPDTEDNDFAVVTAYSSTTTFVTGRYYNVDAAGVLRHSENLIAGVERNETERHGDYFSMFQDPVDGNRIWMVAQYVPSGGSPGPGTAVVASALFEGAAVSTPPPVPDSDLVSGLPLRVTGVSGLDVTITWDPACGADDHHLVWYDFAGLSSFTPLATECGVGTSGTWSGTAPSGNWTVLVVSNDGVDTEGSYGFRNDGGVKTERAASIAACSIVQKNTDGVCP